MHEHTSSNRSSLRNGDHHHSASSSYHFEQNPPRDIATSPRGRRFSYSRDHRERYPRDHRDDYGQPRHSLSHRDFPDSSNHGDRDDLHSRHHSSRYGSDYGVHPGRESGGFSGEYDARRSSLHGDVSRIERRESSVVRGSPLLEENSPGVRGRGTGVVKYLQNCRTKDLEKFNILHKIGEGTHGVVYKAENTRRKQIVALKKINLEGKSEGFPTSAIREIKLLKLLRHEHIVTLIDIVTTSGEMNKDADIFIEFEYCDHDLAGLLKALGDKDEWLSEPEVKCYMFQLLKGLQFLHENNILHRDIKASNLLINNDGVLKIADFGLARPIYESQGRYTIQIITLWYRPPEIFLGQEEYGIKVDMWSVGCILGHMLVRKPLIHGGNEMEVLERIYQVLGTPNPDIWHGFDKLPRTNQFQFKKIYPPTLQQRLEHFGFFKYKEFTDFQM
eukprot:TRINITY_DN6495_c0_g1_i2.p1 TRINITY_DN6495_c0_g1~~TRINITY_DN6495_c0_g1_i2.p1  ORF type:complete len:445 (+),score=64.19 TRINITY_DN6495_c0_g1_i2:6-1340(+)